MSQLPQSQSLRVLLTDGSSTSAREAVTLLGRAGHRVEICDPGRVGLARFSRHVARWHRCPGLRDDPLGFRRFVMDLVAQGGVDVVLPIHDQGLALAGQDLRAAIALPSFASYRTAHSKAGFSHLLDALNLAQPATRIVSNPYDLRAMIHYPCVVKTAIGTASRGVWQVRGGGDVAPMFAALDGHGGEILVQDRLEGALEKAQAVFAHGELLGFHAYRQISEGAGGGDAIKVSVTRPKVRDQTALMGQKLNWHGALSVDYILLPDGVPHYIDCNPRLVEPMSAACAGVDLLGLLLKVSLDEKPAALAAGHDQVVTHQAMQVLLGCGLRGGTRRDILRSGLQLLRRTGPFTESTEELTPWRDDIVSAIPPAITALALLASPRLAGPLARRGWGAHLLNEASIALLAGTEKV
ncbi:MAG: hypothetical protein JWR79_1481 [Tardiphaga sp.]|nr:hypothetical protein [Tardiphaga sp.]